MRQFFVFMSVFLLALLALDRTGSEVLDRAYLSMRNGQNGGQINAYLDQPRTPDLVIMGNSRVYHNINPASFGQQAANLAHNGTGQMFHTGVLHVLQQAHRLPATVVLHIDLDEYAQPATPGGIGQLSYFYQRNAYVTEQMDALGWAERVKNFSALYRHNGRVFSLVKVWLRPDASSDHGFRPIAPSDRDSVNTLYSGRQLWVHQHPLNRAPLQALQQFIAVCKAEHVQLVCFTSPYYKRPPYLAVTSELVDSLLRSQHVAYLNYGLRPVAALQRSTRYWRDDTHLNARGVPLQSQALAQQVSALLGQPPTSVSLATDPHRKDRAVGHP